MKKKQAGFTGMIAFLFICIFSACNNTVSPEPTGSVSRDSMKRQAILIDGFTVSPETDSCACFFSVDSSAYSSQHYIFAYDLSTIAYMKIDGAMTKFKQTEYAVIGAGSLTTFEGNDLKVFLELKDVKKTGEEATLQWGSIRVMDKYGNAVITPFFGACLCKRPLGKKK